ncbi:MAG TPA: tetratricopeptide repeat protein [Candidatus Udaeobacter sp.]|nr:tetratricopeptide repeat protein [Candidatus Udaeobacter sp.]
MTSFLSQLKQRRVYRVAIGYAIVAWLMVQIAATVLPAFHASEVVLPVLIVLLGVGFPVALVLAWAFDVTPSGIEKTPEEAGTTAAMNMRHAWALAGFGLLIAAVGVGAYWFWHRPVTKRTATAETANVVAEKTGAGQGAAISEKSIAVLPFENLSDDKSNAYFAEGIQDEILTRLSKIAALKVISRTSTQKYQSAPDNLREVGNQLGVAHILEGSVQKIANAAHINVQLIRSATDEHVWAESYNRKLDDVFSVEGEVATAIAEQLNARLTGAEQKQITDKPTNNPAAYDAYLRGLAIEQNEYGYESYRHAAAAYAQAVQLDPKFALAWARLAVLRSFLFFNTIERNVNTPAAVQEAADRAMALAPEAGESWIARGAYHYRVLRDFQGAVAAYQEAQRRLPNNTFLLQNLAYVLRRIGRWQDAEPNYKKAIELDPRDVSLLSSLGGEFYGYLRRFDDALAAVDRSLQISPDSETAHAIKAGILQNEGRLPEAAQALARVAESSTDDYVIGSRITQAMYERDFDRAIRVIEQKVNSIPAGQPFDSITEIALVQLGFLQEWSGRHADAQQSFARAIQSMKPTPDTVVAPEANGLPEFLALAYAGLGQKQKALEQAEQAVKDYETDAVNKPAAMAARAQIQALFGDHNAAIAVLPELLQVPAGLTVANLKYDPFWDPLRKDPRFQKLCQQ